MATTDHRYQPPGEVHIAHDYEYANLAALQAASGFTINDNRKLALVTDSNDLWILSNWSVPEWTKVSDEWTIVSNAAELVAATTRQDKNILMKIGVYGITAPITLYDDLIIKGEGNYLSDDGSAGVLIELGTLNQQAFTHTGTVSSDFGFSTAPIRGDFRLELDAAIGAILPAGDTIVAYNMSTKTVAHILGVTTAATDTSIRLHNTFPWDTTLASYPVPTTFKYYTNPLKNVSFENISFSNPNATAVQESIFIEAGINISVKKCQTISPTNGNTHGVLLKSVVGVHIEEVNGEFNNDYEAWSLVGCSEVTVKNTGLDPEIEGLGFAYWVHLIDRCYNLKLEDIRGTNLWIDNCTQFEISNYHREFIGTDNEDFSHNSYFSFENCSVGNVGVDNGNTPFKIDNCNFFKIDNMNIRTTVTGSNITDAAFYFHICNNYSIAACSADNAVVPIYHSSSTNYKEYGNAWQGDIIHEGIATSAGITFPGTYTTSHLSLEGGNYEDFLGETVSVRHGNPLVYTVYTGVAAAPQANEFVVETKLLTTLTNLRNAINNSSFKAITVVSATNFSVDGDISGDGVGGNDGVGVIRAITSNTLFVDVTSGTFVSPNGVDNTAVYVANETTISSIDTASSDVTASALSSPYTQLKVVADVIGTATTFDRITSSLTSTLITKYVGFDSIAQGSAGTGNYVIGRDSGIDSSSEECTIINSPNSYINYGWDSAIMAGDKHTMMADKSCIIGGESNIMTEYAFKCFIVGGEGNLISEGTDSGIMGGYNNEIGQTTTSNLIIGCNKVYDFGSSGFNSTFGCQNTFLRNYSYNCFTTGESHLVDGQYKFTHGRYGVNVSQLNGDQSKVVYAHGGVAKRAQTGKLINTTTTIDAVAKPTTPTPSEVNNETWDSYLTAVTVYAFKIKMVATQTAGTAGTVGDTCVKEYEGVVKLIKSTDTLSFVGNISETIIAYDISADAWGLLITANNTNNTLDIQAQGVADKTIEFMWELKTTELGK